jgi:endonuclease/exonuclease/phosphatase family metal-dependent hydrolase
VLSQAIITVLTFNLWMVPDIGPRVVSIFKEERIQMICNKFKEFANREVNPVDIIIMQEIWPNQLKKKLKRCGYKHHSFFDDKKVLHDSGLMVLSRYPIKESKRHTFEKNGSLTRVITDGEYFANKSIQMVRVKHPEKGDVWISNTHLISEYSVNGSDTYERVRFDQFEKFVNWSYEVAGDLPLVLGGDINFGPHSRLWHMKLIQDLLKGFSTTKDSDNVCTVCPPNFMNLTRQRKLDHVFGANGFKAVSGKRAMDEPIEIYGNQINYSDHFGWETTFIFEEL